MPSLRLTFPVGTRTFPKFAERLQVLIPPGLCDGLQPFLAELERLRTHR